MKNTTKASPQSGLLTMYSLATPPEIFDIRCEYEVPRYVDLNNLEDDDCDMMASSGYYGVSFNAWPERKQSTTGGARMQQVA